MPFIMEVEHLSDRGWPWFPSFFSARILEHVSLTPDALYECVTAYIKAAWSNPCRFFLLFPAATSESTLP
ncbi:hypothetical protein SERLA73DRAFT_178556 [Serpula lacrymans var. lacrymans S7.3]|uniref:Uncharacterized protein n=2 Tax=Serpula lacrymans var. lacrymans TaxID=341189 RepID=F8PS13_SERL3|nr:uncharacterized protein SERLADRAFT_447465 [Serpula lacrymans var. lacrymans S7.9]EGO00679.1 hypothetical protein SERLA73DRAFT_178556 [Serpula lacrymans var. lacrymans S7.3]EGO26231.1 hypothetical protein SERLADRAFT_447465 [Serpula lacrymans var. lacrymans S7.9]